MTRAIVKIRTVGLTLVVTLPRSVLADSTLHAGDRVMITSEGPTKFTIEKETGENAKAETTKHKHKSHRKTEPKSSGTTATAQEQANSC